MLRTLFVLTVCLLTGLSARAAATLPTFVPAGADSRIGEWLFQPGEAVAKPPQVETWEAVKVPFLWTSGDSRMLKPEGRPLVDWAKAPAKWSANDNGWFERTMSVPVPTSRKLPVP